MRGISAENLLKASLWFNGPPELLTSPVRAPHPPSMEGLHLELRSTTLMVADVVDALPTDRWETYGQILRILCYILRFTRILKGGGEYDTRDTPLHRDIIVPVELQEAEFRLFRYLQEQCYSNELACLRQGRRIVRHSSIVQLKPFLGPRGLLRVGGRLHLALLDYAEKHPIILPQSRVVALLVRQEHIRLKHTGLATLITTLRTRFWIVGVRRLVHKIRSSCVSCLRQDTAGQAPPPPPLPTDRIHPSASFAVSGLDHASSLYCTDSGDSKKYILLFT